MLPEVNRYLFRVALSFPGEHRRRIESIAKALAAELGETNVLYDSWHRAKLAGFNTGILLPDLYRDESQLIVAFLCKEYKKPWAGLEWRAIIDLQMNGQADRIMLLALDEPHTISLPGLYSIDTPADIRSTPDHEVAALILERLKIPPVSIDEAVCNVRANVLPDIQYRCGTIRVLTMEKPIDLGTIYIDINMLAKRTANLRTSLPELLKEAKADDLNRFGLASATERIPAIQALQRHRHLMVYGKPGAGKTTFLKRLAMECAAGNFLPKLVPAFVVLHDFAESGSEDLSAYLQLQWNLPKALAVLKAGRALILLDGLDEVRDRHFTAVRKAIEAFSANFCECHIILTCRIAAREYAFERFAEVELADFDKLQIQTFAHRWFGVQGQNAGAPNFLAKLQANKPVFELASSPLLLTLLCLVFEEGNYDFEGTRAELYREGLDVLLRKWDSKRGIERDRPHGLSISVLEDLLAEVAYGRFKASEYFFAQASLEHQIEQFFATRNLLGLNEDLVPEHLLNSIESHLGLLVQRAVRVYSFSHLTFQEYFTAQKIAKMPSLLSEVGLHVGDPSWDEVWLLLITMLATADDVIREMLMFVNRTVESNSKIQEYLRWCSLKANEHRGDIKSVDLRALYFALPINFDRALDRACALAPDGIEVDTDIEETEHNHDIDFASGDYYLGCQTATDIDFELRMFHPEMTGIDDRGRPVYRNRDLAHLRSLHCARALAFAHDFNHALNTAPALNQALGIDHTRAIDLARAVHRERTLDLDFALSRALYLDLAFAPVFDQAVLFARALARAVSVARKLALAFSKELEPLCVEFDPLENDHEALALLRQCRTRQETLRAVAIRRRNIGQDWSFTQSERQLIDAYDRASQLLLRCTGVSGGLTNRTRQLVEDTLYLPGAQNPADNSGENRN